jgi:hypothetical protein
MTKVSPGYKYWILYEGVPGGEMDADDFWYSSANDQPQPIDQTYTEDLPSPEWIAFGDPDAPRMIYLLHHEDDDQPDGYINRADMTVFGFGRLEKEKYLDTPQTFSIGFVESTEYKKIEHFVEQSLE